jgi:hypothetical protein
MVGATKRRRMSLLASRRVDGFTVSLTSNASQAFLLTAREDGNFLEAYDERLAQVWSKRLESGAVALLVADRVLWVLDAEGAWACGDGGQCNARVQVSPPDGMRLSAFTRLNDGFVFACDHANAAKMQPAVLKRVNDDGTTRWSATLPTRKIEHKDVATLQGDTGSRSMRAWTPRSWVATSPILTVSGDAVLACFSERHQTDLGLGYAVGLSDGTLRFTTESGPISQVAPLGDGAFLIGYQGYGAIETLRYEPDGRVLDRWPSHGHYVMDGGVRVLETENVVPSRTHLVRLLPGGAVQKGESVDGYHTSRPVLGADGAIYFFHRGEILAARELSVTERLVLEAPDNNFLPAAMAGDDRGFFVNYRRGAESILVRIEV